ncbi:uncharacterized protein LOC110010027 [Jatropha curcas]|uniref:uncharacterized protein LOC110010027 n=1 Tax=Jatropha curcas TaxID=180498 RepID=UPI0009D71F7B|nr:uncharacterized protein LOC110010027 [Jatropha curcas]
MAKKEARKVINSQISRENYNNNGVIITVYIELPRRRPNKKMAMSNPSSKRIRCDNRRAELLAYARELRDSSSHKQEWQPRRNSSRPKSEKQKWKWLSAQEKIQTSLERIFRRKQRQCGYERIATEEYGGDDEFHNKRKAASRGKSASSFCRKLKRVLKELSCGLQCSKRI